MQHFSGIGLSALLVVFVISIAIYLKTPTSTSSSISQEIVSSAGTASIEQPKTLADWSQSVMRHVNRFKLYPADAKNLNQQGKVVVSVTVDNVGIVVDSKIINSSHFPVLDNNALQTIDKASPLPWPPRGLLKDNQITITLPITYSLAD